MSHHHHRAEEKDKDDCLIISRSGDDSSSTSREAGIKKEEDQVALFSAAAAAAAVVDAVSSHKKRRRRRSSSSSSKAAENKKEWQSAAELNAASASAAAAAYYKKYRLVERKKKPLITVDKKIPAGVLTTSSIKGSAIKFNMHKSLANKKVLLYGLPTYKNNRVAISTVSKEYMDQCEQWRPFFQNSFVKPVLDFLKHADYLKETGVAETVFFSATGQGLMFSFKKEEIRKRQEYVTIVTDYVNRYLHALGMEMDIPQKGMPPRSRRFILLLDNLKVKFVRIESSDRNFTIPSNEEIIKAFDQ